MKSIVLTFRIPLFLLMLFYSALTFAKYDEPKTKKIDANEIPPVGITLTSAVGTNSQSVCEGSSITNITYSITGIISTVTVTGLPIGVIDNRSGNNLTITGTPAIAGVSNYTITAMLTSGATLTASGSITASSTASVTTNVTACDSYAWAASGQTYTTSGTRSVVVGCHTEFLNLTIVPSGPYITLSSDAATTQQSVCTGQSITNISYAVPSTVGGVNVSSVSSSGFPPGVSGSLSNGSYVISGAPTVPGTFNYTIYLSGINCAIGSLTGTITVSTAKGTSTLTLTSGAGTNTTSVCNNAAISSITYSVGSSYGANTITGVSVSGLPSGVTGALANGVYTLSGTPTTAGVFNYSIQTTGDLCTNASASGTITVNATSSNTTTASACDSYVWSVNGQTYTTSGNYSSVSGCHTEYLNLTITTSSSNTITASACDSYVWSVNGQTYTTSGSYSSVSGCHTEYLNLTITASTSNTTTISACDSYTWSVNGQTYTTSGSYTSVSGCHTEYLNLTITASSSNTTTTTACDSYVWSVNGQTYTTSGSYSSVSGCHTENLNLTITASTSNTTTISACDSYTWSVNGQTYTTSGSYSSVSGCNTEYLNLTITTSSSNTTTISACDSYLWSVNGQTYTTSGSYSSVSGCNTEYLNLTIIPSTSNTTVATVCGSYTWAVNGQTYTSSGTYSSVNGCHTEYLNLTINNFSFTSYSVTGGGAYCTGGTGVAVGLSGSQVGVNYQLKLNGVNTGSLLTGTGSALNFGLKTAVGTYTVQATAVGSVCTAAMAGSVSVSVNSNPTAGITNNTGTTVLSATVVQIRLTATGGTSYSWSNGSGVVGATANYTVTAPGTYTVTVFNAAGCSSTASITITSSVLSVTGVVTHILCNGLRTGAINVTVSGGRAPYTYRWSSGQRTEDISGLSAGTYSITVTDAAGTRRVQAFTILQPTLLVLNTVSTNLTCTGGLGTITPTASGGTAPYTITINTGASLVNGSFVGLPAGNYTITLRDANNCTVTRTVTISAFVPVTFTRVVTPNSSCTPNGFITVTASGGSAPYSYSKDGGTTWQASNTLGALAPGTYPVRVKDVNNCLSTIINVVVTDNGSDGFEANNTRTAAKAIILETLYSARIGVVNDQDWFSYRTVSGSGGGTYYLVFAQAIAGQTYDLYDSRGRALPVTATGAAGIGTVYKQYNGLAANTTYSIRIAGTQSLTCYKFKFSRALPVAALPLVAFGVNGTPSSNLSTTFEGKLRVFPNPVKHQLLLELENEGDEIAEIVIRNAQGGAVYRRSMNLVKNRQVIEMTVSNLPSGFYVCQLVKKSGIKSVKFLKD